MIPERRPKSVSELAILTRRAEQNLLRTLHKMSEAGLVRLDRGEGRAYQPVVTARTVHFEIDLLAEQISILIDGGWSIAVPEMKITA